MLLQYSCWHERIHCFSETIKIPLDCSGLLSIAVSLSIICGVAYKILREIVDEAERSIVDGNSEHTHIVGV
jgi:hypothetical protein